MPQQVLTAGGREGDTHRSMVLLDASPREKLWIMKCSAKFVHNASIGTVNNLQMNMKSGKATTIVQLITPKCWLHGSTRCEEHLQSPGCKGEVALRLTLGTVTANHSQDMVKLNPYPGHESKKVECIGHV